MMDKIYTAKLPNFGILPRDFTDLDLDPFAATSSQLVLNVSSQGNNQINLTYCDETKKMALNPQTDSQSQASDESFK